MERVASDWRIFSMAQRTPKWDAGRFWQTVVYFKVLEPPAWIRTLFQGAIQGPSIQSEGGKMPVDNVIFDFQHPSGDLKEIWGALDDVVMGGVSQSGIRLVENSALFSGNVSTDNSGGFASIRTRNFETPFDLSGYEGLEIRARGDGKRYKFMLRSETKWDGIAYCYSFDTQKDIWTTARIPFAQMIPVSRAKTLRDVGPLDTRQVYSFQIMLSKFEYDGGLNPSFSPGYFELQVESIKAY
jgi:Complex I intermediate-associated protein 30 (CIA30)